MGGAARGTSTGTVADRPGLAEEEQELVSRKSGSMDSPGDGGLCGTLWR
jgi:hypothetical protein